MILPYSIHLRDFDFQIKNIRNIQNIYLIYYTKNNTIKFHILFAIDAVLRSEYNIFELKIQISFIDFQRSFFFSFAKESEMWFR